MPQRNFHLVGKLYYNRGSYMCASEDLLQTRCGDGQTVVLDREQAFGWPGVGGFPVLEVVSRGSGECCGGACGAGSERGPEDRTKAVLS